MKGIIRLIVITLVLIAVYHFTRLEMFSIEHISIEGGHTIAHETLRARAEQELVGTYLGLIPKRFSYLYPHDRIVKVLEQISRVRAAEVTRSARTGLAITFEEYMPHALWCREGSPDAPCYFLAENGYAFDEAPSLQGGAFIRHFSHKSDDKLPGQVIEEETLASINAFIEQAETVLAFRINSVTHMPGWDVSFAISGGGTILVSLKKDLRDTMENIAATLNTENFAHIAPGNFQYIDARFDNKLFINEELAVASSTADTLSE